MLRITAFDSHTVSHVALNHPFTQTSAAASGEAGLEESLSKIAKGWEKTEFTVLHHRDQAEIFILGGLDEVRNAHICVPYPTFLIFLR